MNYQDLHSDLLVKSRVCLFVVFDSTGNLRLSNNLFRTHFPEADSPAANFFNLVAGNSEPLQAFTRNTGGVFQHFDFTMQSGDLVLLTGWDFEHFADDTGGYIKGIGIIDKVQPATVSQSLFPQTGTQQSDTSVDSQYKFLFYKNPQPMWIYDIKTLAFIEVNEAAIEQYGYSKEEFLNMTIADIRPTQDVERLMDLQKTSGVNRDIYKGLWRHKKKNGDIIDVHVSAHLLTINGAPAKLVLAEDRTNQLRSREKLLQSNERFMLASRASFDAIWDWDLTTGKVLWSDGYKLIFGYDDENIEDHFSTFNNLVHPDDRERVTSALSRAIKTGASNWLDEFRFKKADGSYAHVIDKGIIIKNPEGKAVRMIGAMQDNTKRKNNEQQLQQINHQLRRQQKERELTASILRSLSENELLNDALQDILRKLTIFFNFEIGEAWFVNLDKVRLELRQKWYGDKEMDVFYRHHPNVTYRVKKSGVLGHLWSENEIIFVDDLPNYESFVRKKGAEAAGLTKSLGVPILFNGEPIAVFSFFGKKEMIEREKMKAYFESLSLQLGLDIQRKKTEEELNQFFKLSPDILSIIGFDGFFKKINNAFVQILGFDAEAIKQLHFEELMHPDDLDITFKFFSQLKEGKTVTLENRFKTANGNYKWLSWAAAPIIEERLIYATAKDISDRRELDSRLNRIMESVSDGLITVDKESNVLYWNPQAEKLLKLKSDMVLGKKLFQIFKDKVPDNFFDHYIKAFEGGSAIDVEEYIPSVKKWFEVSVYPYQELMTIFFKDITERKKSDEIVRISSERYEALAKATKDAIWDWNLLTNTVEWNEGIRTIFNYENISVTTNSSWWSDRIHPDDAQRVGASLHEHIEKGLLNWESEYRFRCADGSYKHIFDRGFTIYNNENQPVRMVGSMQDLSETKATELTLKELNESLEKRAQQLATSNAELESFAYVASHDLQEPLRMVSSFLQLIEKKYREKLDAKAHEYIRFAVDGADRMKGLILDLLEYSRVNSRRTEKEEVDLNEVAQNLNLTYKKLLEELGGTLQIEEMPVLLGNRSQLMQLFQNLVSNAIKYRSDRPPVIKISVADQDKNFQFSVTDNGIGIEPRFFNKVFVIFQRLHNKNEYSGTGIGLAICKKIVDLHSGNIWIESTPGKGSTFFFTIPKNVESNTEKTAAEEWQPVQHVQSLS